MLVKNLKRNMAEQKEEFRAREEALLNNNQNIVRASKKNVSEHIIIQK